MSEITTQDLSSMVNTEETVEEAPKKKIKVAKAKKLTDEELYYTKHIKKLDENDKCRLIEIQARKIEELEKDLADMEKLVEHNTRTALDKQTALSARAEKAEKTVQEQRNKYNLIMNGIYSGLNNLTTTLDMANQIGGNL